MIYVPSHDRIYALTAEEQKQIIAEEQLFQQELTALVRARESGDKAQLDAAKQALVKKMKDEKINVRGTDPKAVGKDLTEIIRLRGKHYTYVRSEKLGNHRRSYKMDAKDRERSGKNKIMTDGKIDLKKIQKQIKKNAKPDTDIKWTWEPAPDKRPCPVGQRFCQKSFLAVRRQRARKRRNPHVRRRRRSPDDALYLRRIRAGYV